MSFREIQLRFMKVMLKMASEKYEVVAEDASDLIKEIDYKLLELNLD